ncbi:hypothetical protein [Sphingomonas sp. Leaf38]|uniref:hypothetical protein n=1 Tax=Sphingomonas sp. Leaf38 TaxID=1736217 RepID=UPI0006FB8296|nr:hypothetical protein [Sphingomonas sp. Leaf38]KQN24723.1 hypothetical protein ASE88_16975 [Sphingomonas sp. Leaf38]
MITLADRVSSTAFVHLLCGYTSRIVDALDQQLARDRIWTSTVALIIVLQLSLIFGHRPWLDEWQALQLALQSPTLADLFRNLRYEGHPPLWYLMLRAGGALVGPYNALPVTAAMLAIATQMVIAFACPFSRAERVLLATGTFVLFEFLTLSRSLTLGVAVLVFAMALWRHRSVWLMIALLPMCDFLFGALSGILLVLQWRDGRLWRPGVALWLASGVMAGWSVMPAPDMIPALEHKTLLVSLADYLASIGLLAVPLQWGEHGPTWNGGVPFSLGGFAGILFLLFAATQLRNDWLARALFWGFVTLTLGFSVTVYPLPSRHLMLIALLLILLTWRGAADQTIKPSAGFRSWLAVGSACGLFVAAWNFVVPFDTADAAGRAIVSRGLGDKHWMVFPDSRAQGVSALTGIAFERTEARCMQDFIHWNFRSALRDPKRLTTYLRHEVATRGRFYLLSDLPLSPTVPRDLLLPITYIPAGYDAFAYYLFVVGPDRPEVAKNTRFCVPNQRPLRGDTAR